MSAHDPFVRLRHMRDYAREAVSLISGKTRAHLETERLLDLSLMHLLTIIGEAANRIPEDLQKQHPEIAWPLIVGMRNRLIHGYDAINYDILWQTVAEDLPHLITLLEKIIPPDPPRSIR